MKINILYLYYDILNLNGEHANILGLKRHFELQKVECNVSYKTIGDKIKFSDYDIVYMGQGSEESSLMALKDLNKRKKDVIDAIEKGIYFFVTGTSLELFGRYVQKLDKTRTEMLHIFDYYTKYIDIENYSEECKFRVVEDTVAASKFIDQKIIGFQNRAGLIYENDDTFFVMMKGTGNNIEDKNEGFNYKNFYATYLIGPLFIRNPYLTDFFVKKIIKEKDKNYKLLPIKEDYEYKAYKQYFINFPNM